VDLETIRTLYRYSEWANDRLIAAALKLTPEQAARPIDGSVRDAVAHIAVAEYLWLERWKGISPTELPSWATSDVAGLAEELRKVALERTEKLNALSAEDLLQTFRAKNLKRDITFEFPVGVMLLHVANHSTYHRGQLSSLIRQAGGKSVATDITIYAAEHGR
jgi:uncharacterized damage-inducible protein DinB